MKLHSPWRNDESVDLHWFVLYCRLNHPCWRYCDGVDAGAEGQDRTGRCERPDDVAAELGTIAKIRFRVKPTVPNLWRRTDFTQMSVPIDLGIQVYKSGIPPEYLVEMGRRVFQMPNVELVGLHFHAGRHHPSPWYWRGTMTRFGRLVGEGRTPEEALAEMNTTVEGYVNAKTAVEIAREYGVAMPVIEHVAEVLHNGMSAREAVDRLVSPPPEEEF